MPFHPVFDGLVDGAIMVYDAALRKWKNQRAGVLDFFNDMIIESFDALVTSDGAAVTMSLERSGGGDLTMNFSDGQTTLDCTPAATLALTAAGTDTVPIKQRVYILQSDKILTVGTSWPSAEHIRVGYFFVPSPALVQSKGVSINQNHNDHAMSTDTLQGHMSHITDRLRRFGAKWDSGAQGTATQDGNDLWVSISAGVVLQMHEHDFAALDSDTAGAGDVIQVVNDPDANFAPINSLNEITKHSDGDPIGNNKYVKFVLWGVANKTGEFSPMMINLPSEQYNTQVDAERDADHYADFSIPDEYIVDSSTGFLVAEFVCKHTATAMEIVSTVSLRGDTPGTAGGGRGGGDVTALAVMADHAVLRGDGGAKDIQDSGNLIDDNDNLTMNGQVNFAANGAYFTQQTATGDGTTTIDWTAGNKFKFTFGALNETFTFSPEPSGATNLILMLIQDGVGGRTATWPADVKWRGGTAPVLSTGASAIDIVSFYYDGTDFYGLHAANFS